VAKYVQIIEYISKLMDVFMEFFIVPWKPSDPGYNGSLRLVLFRERRIQNGS